METGKSHPGRTLSKMRLLTACILVLLLAATVLSGCGGTVDIDASVFYSEGMFTIVNNGDFGWHEVELYLNYTGDDLDSGYSYILNQGAFEKQVITGLRFVEPASFFNGDGEQYKETEEAPQIMLVRIRTEDGKSGEYVKSFDS